MNDYLSRQLIADRQTAVTASMRNRAQVREARTAARRARTEDRPMSRTGFRRFTVRRAAAAVLS